MVRKIVWLLAVSALLLAGCSGGSGGQGFSKRTAAGKEQVLRYPIVTSPSTLDPHAVEDGDTIDLLQQVFESLTVWGEDNQVKPGLAESWTIENNGSTYVFKLRTNAKFHNGRSVTAEDVKWSLERACNPALASPVAGTYLSDIVGVADRLAGKSDTISGVVVRDPATVAISLLRPIPFFPAKLTYLTAAVVPKESVPANTVMKSTTDMVGTGPYKAKSYSTDQLFVLEANPDYYLGAPKIARIERPIIKDAATRLLKYKNGELDLVQLERGDVSGLQSDAKFKDQLQFFDRAAIWYMGMAGNAYPPFKNRDVRRAFAMAVDREQIVKETLGGINQLANGILPPAVTGARAQAAVLPFDPTAAKALLAKAGYPDPAKMPPIEFNYRDSRPDVRLVAENLAAQLQKNLGVKTNLRSMEWGAYLQKKDRGELQLYHMRWGADYLDPENFLTLLLTTSGPENKMGYSNPEVDKLCAEADVMPLGPERDAKYARAEDLILQDAPWMPIYFQRDAELIAPRVKGMRHSLFGHLPHTTVTLE